MSYHLSALHEGHLFSVHDVHCRARASGCGGEEWASSHHVVFVRSGVFVKHVGRRHFVADPTRVLFFNKDEIYRVSHPVDGGDTCTMLACAPQVWTDLLARHDASAADRPHAPFSMSHTTLLPRTNFRYQRLRDAIRRGSIDALEVDETALELVDDVLTGARPLARPASSRRRATRDARHDLAEHTALVLASRPEDRHSLGALARVVNASPFHLARVFREETGTSIHQHLLKLRLGIALERVLDRSKSLSEIAHALGFSSHAHFATLFRRAYGVAPSAIRHIG